MFPQLSVFQAHIATIAFLAIIRKALDFAASSVRQLHDVLTHRFYKVVIPRKRGMPAVDESFSRDEFIDHGMYDMYDVAMV